MKSLQPLTPEEQELAVKHFNLVDEFLHRKRLDPNEYYDVVIFGYLAAIQQGCRKDYPEEKKNFFGLIEVCMRNAVYQEWIGMGREKRKANQLSISLDAMLNADEDEFPIYEIIEDARINIEDLIVNRDLIDRLLTEATPREREAFEYACLGFNLQETAEIMDVSSGTIRRFLYNFREKARAAAENRKDIYDLQCKEKRRTKARAYRETYKEEIREKSLAYRKTHKEKISEKNHTYWDAHKEEINAKRRSSYAAKRDAERQSNTQVNSLY